VTRRFAGDATDCALSLGAARTESAEARTIAAGFDGVCAGFDGSAAKAFGGSAEAAPATARTPTMRPKDKRIALSITSARDRETAFLHTFANWLKAKQDSAKLACDRRKLAVISMI